MTAGTGLSRVGFLDMAGAFADTRRVDGPGHHHNGGQTVQTWNVDGRKATNRAGVAEYLGLAPTTIAIYAAPSGRARYGFPEPLPQRVDGQELFALDELDEFAAKRAPRKRQPRAIEGDPDELIGVAEFAKIRGVSPDTFRRYVTDSLNAWARNQDGYLPRPDEVLPARRGNTYRWRRATAIAWSFPAVRRKPGGRKAGRRPTVDDLRRVLAAVGKAKRPTTRELAAELSRQLGTDVSSQVVRRLRNRMQEQDAAS